MDKFTIFMTAGTLDITFVRLFELAKSLSVKDVVDNIIVQGVGAKKFFIGTDVQAFEYIRKEIMDDFIVSSDLIISHCGVGSIVNSVTLQKPTVLIPRRKCYQEHFDDHQMQIFDKVKGNPLFCCCDQQELSPEDVIGFYYNYTSHAIYERDNEITNRVIQADIGQYFAQLGATCES